MRKERLARGWTLREFAARSGIDYATASLIETGKRPPNERVARACDKVFPERHAWFVEYYEESQTWIPAGFRDWSEHEDKALGIRVWSTGVVDGLLQTEAYARALLRTVPGVTDEMVNARLANRMERQRRVLYRDEPLEAWFVVDEVALYRLVGSAEAMAEQVRHLLEVARLPNVTLQVLPIVGHPAIASSFMVADGRAAYIDHLTGGLVYSEGERVTSMVRLFDTLRGESYRVSESLKMLERLGDGWTGEQLVIPLHRAGSA
jgi:transcriptional regulator with XRE-family HTH domain